MAANYNFSVIDEGLKYKDSSGTEVTLYSDHSVFSIANGAKSSTIATVVAKLAPIYTKSKYSAKSLVRNGDKIYYNPSAIETAENWTAAHWTETTIAEYIKIMTT